MSLAPGTRFGPFEIVSPLGAGGMGEVYRARDTRLKRDVALKFLPPAFATDPDRLARFHRESEVLASLNHPNIAQLYGFEESNGTSALVMELVDGETVADRIARGPIPLDEALPISRQIAEALEAAHEQGIIHRDLKPANIKVRPDGTVKVLDFGLAKLAEAPAHDRGPANSLSMSPTITSPAMTGVGVLLGTAAYMAPEQAKGRPADTRSDIWAFGCVLYEMLTGKRAFDGEDVADTLAAVLRAEPRWAALPPDTPPGISRTLKRCLEKARRDRLPHIGAARLELVDALGSTDEGAPSPLAPHPPAWLPWSITIAALITLIGSVLFNMASTGRSSPSQSDQPGYRSAITLPANFRGDSISHLALSPDGRRLAFVAATVGGQATLWVRSLDGADAQPLVGTENAAAPFWSPDSRSIAFVAGGKLRRIDVAGGRIITLCDAEAALPGAWNGDGVILFTPRIGAPLFRVAAAGGMPSPVTSTGSAGANIVHAFPSFLPDGRHFIFLAQSPNGSNTSMEVGSLDMKERKQLLSDVRNSQYAAGHIVYLRDTTLFAQSFDPVALEFAGDPLPLAEDVDALVATMRFGATFTMSQGGALIYKPGSSAGSQLVWFDRAGKSLGALPSGNYNDFVTVAPDGRQVAVQEGFSGGGSDITVWDARQTRSRLTADPAPDTYPVWSPDGRRVVFTSRRKGHLDLYIKDVAAPLSSETALLTNDLDKFPTSWSPDGRFILFNARTSDTGTDLWVLPLDGDGKPRPFIQTSFTERYGMFSPDGHWVAYVSDESGQSEIHVASFPEPGTRHRISTDGGSNPQWRADGKELFFVAADGKMMSVPVASNGKTFDVGAPRALFALPPGRSGYFWDVAPDGQRFIVITPAEEKQVPSLALVVNWPALTRQ